MSALTIGDEASWDSLPFAVVDLEGNGQHPPDLVELAVIPIDLGVPAPARSWLVKPSQKITYHATRIHGIKNADVESAPSFDAVSNEVFESLVGRCLVAHNASVDWDVLHRKMPTLRPPAVIDTLRLTRAVCPGRASYSLDKLITHLDLQRRLEGVAGGRHRATYDATAALYVFLHAVMQTQGRILSFREILSLGGLPKIAASDQQALF